MTSRDGHYPGLDGLRGAAAFVVVFLHGTLFVKGIRHTPEAACLAVDFFFMLSGFVVAHAYDHRLRSGMGWRAFMITRAIRLYPMLFIGTALGGSIYVLSHVEKHDLSLLTIVAVASGSLALLPVGLAIGTRLFR